MSELKTRTGIQPSTILFIWGVLCSSFGVLLHFQRVAFAKFLFAASFMFGIPLTTTDALKVLLVEIAGFATVGFGLVFFVFATTLVLKSTETQSNAHGVQPTPTHR